MNLYADLVERTDTRPIKITTNINPYAEGSALVEFGKTKVHVTARVEESVPPFLKGKGSGWLTAEYSMLPSATHTRNRREREKMSGRTHEIQRLIGRALRAAVDLKSLGERSVLIDCDVLVADGGTRTASITGAYVALALALKKIVAQGACSSNVLKKAVAAISVGVNKGGKVIVDLNYDEDSSCETDMNIVMDSEGGFIEVQGTAEGKSFSHDQLLAMLGAAKQSLAMVFTEQAKAIEK